MSVVPWAPSLVYFRLQLGLMHSPFWSLIKPNPHSKPPQQLSLSLSLPLSAHAS